MEAEIIHMIDNLDAEMMMMTTALGLVGPGEMTNKIFAMENRSFYKPNLDQKRQRFLQGIEDQKEKNHEKTTFFQSECSFFSVLMV